MTHLTEPFHSVVPDLDPARGLTPPPHLRRTVLAAVAEVAAVPDADSEPAPRRSRRRPASALVAVCLVMLAAAGVVAGLRATTASPADPGTAPWPGLPDRTPRAGAQLPALASCPSGYLLAPPATQGRTGRGGYPTPQEAALGYESPNAAVLAARGLVYKEVQPIAGGVRVHYFDAHDRALQELVVARMTNGSWRTVETRDCVHREGVPERTDLRLAQVDQRCPGATSASIVDHVAGAGEDLPQIAVDQLERGWLRQALGDRAATKVVQRSADEWDIAYLDAEGRYVGSAVLTSAPWRRWVLDRTAACQP